MTKRNSATSAGSLTYVVIVCLFAFIKSYIFYQSIYLSPYELPLSLATVAILLLLYSLISFISPRAGKITLTVFYIIMSLLMAIDAVHYAYVSTLPSVIKLGMVSQLGDITDTILGLIKVKHILLIADFPAWLFYLVIKCAVVSKIQGSRMSAAYTSYVKPHFGKFMSALAGIGVTAILTIVIFSYPGFRTEYMLNELFCYHVNDVVVSWFLPREKIIVDEEEYSSPNYSEGEDYGIASGRNVIVIQVEAMQNFLIGASYDGQEIMPNLNALIGNDSFYFKNYYYQIGGGNTSDAEFTVNNSLFAPEAESAYMKYVNKKFYGLPFILKDNGYSGAHAFHGYTGSFWNREAAYVGQGFDDFTSLEDFEQTDIFGMGLSDRRLYAQAMEQIITFDEPFYTFFITLSSHYPYGIPLYEREITMKAEDDATLFGLYLQSMNYTDRMIGLFIEQLKDAGLYDNSVIVIYGDHYALSNTDAENSKRVSELLGRPYSVFDVFNIPLIINVPGMGKNEVCEIAGGHIDVLPTLLYLLGITNDKSVMFGQNLLEAEEGFVCEQAHMSRGSFISDKVFFRKPQNNIESNYDAYEFGTMNRLDPKQFYEQSAYAEKRIKDCEELIEEDRVMISKPDED